MDAWVNKSTYMLHNLDVRIKSYLHALLQNPSIFVDQEHEPAYLTQLFSLPLTAHNRLSWSHGGCDAQSKIRFSISRH
jgi:hypothetical protein